VERKVFHFCLRENDRGRFLRIIEVVGGRHEMIIIPTTGLSEFKRVLEAMIKAAEEIPPPVE
jgi:hypothetical protein